MSTQRGSRQFRQICFVTNLVKTWDPGVELCSEWLKGINSSFIDSSPWGGHQRPRVADQCPSFLAKRKVSMAPKPKTRGETQRPGGYFIAVAQTLHQAKQTKKKKKTHEGAWAQQIRKLHFYPSPWNIYSGAAWITDSFAHHKSTSAMLCSSFCCSIKATKVRRCNMREGFWVLYITAAWLRFDTVCWFNILGSACVWKRLEVSTREWSTNFIIPHDIIASQAALWAGL